MHTSSVFNKRRVLAEKNDINIFLYSLALVALWQIHIQFQGVGIKYQRFDLHIPIYFELP